VFLLFNDALVYVLLLQHPLQLRHLLLHYTKSRLSIEHSLHALPGFDSLPPLRPAAVIFHCREFGKKLRPLQCEGCEIVLILKCRLYHFCYGFGCGERHHMSSLLLLIEVY